MDEKYFIGIFTFVMILSGIVYILLSIRMINRYKKYIGQHYSFHERINLNWLSRLIYGITLVWSVVLIVKILQSYNFANIPDIGDYWIFLTTSLFIGFLGFYGIRQTTLFSNLTLNTKTYEINKMYSLKTPYQKSGLKAEQANIIKEKLLDLMNSEKRFLDNKLCMDTLADELGVSSNHLSQVINEHFSKNFYEFINSYRIEEFKTKAMNKKYKSFSVLALAYESGFNSKSVFYSVFKKEVGVKPSEYLKNLS